MWQVFKKVVCFKLSQSPKHHVLSFRVNCTYSKLMSYHSTSIHNMRSLGYYTGSQFFGGNLKMAENLCYSFHWKVESNPPPIKSELILRTCLTNWMWSQWRDMTFKMNQTGLQLHLGLQNHSRWEPLSRPVSSGAPQSPEALKSLKATTNKQ